MMYALTCIVAWPQRGHMALTGAMSDCKRVQTTTMHMMNHAT